MGPSISTNEHFKQFVLDRNYTLSLKAEQLKILALPYNIEVCLHQTFLLASEAAHLSKNLWEEKASQHSQKGQTFTSQNVEAFT